MQCSEMQCSEVLVADYWQVESEIKSLLASMHSPEPPAAFTVSVSAPCLAERFEHLFKTV
jgi:hypothetical protein